MVVVDASVIVDHLLEQLSPAASAVLADDAELTAPELIDYEVASAVRGLALAGEIPDKHVTHVLRQFSQFSIERHSLAESLLPMLELRHNFTVYDAAYIVLARALRVPLVTVDAKMLEAEKVGVEVRLLD